MKKIGFKFNWMSLFFMAPIGALWFLFFISRRVAVFPLNNPTPLSLDFTMIYSSLFLIGMILTALKIKGLYWWEWVEIFFTFKKFEFYKKNK